MSSLTLRSAILVNLNVMVGFGIFVNTVKLSQLTGALGYVAYGLGAILVLPLIISIAKQMQRHPSGGFYLYGARDLHPFAGFISAWAYFVGKLASASLIIHVVMTLFQQLIPLLQSIPILWLDIIVIAIFTFLNTLHMQTGSTIAGFFIALKLTPILFAICCGLYLLHSGPLTLTPTLWSGIPTSLPFILYAFSGFEAACSLSSKIENAHINGPKAIYTSYVLALAINMLYQFLFYATTHGMLMFKSSYLEAFPTLVSVMLPAHSAVQHHLVNILHIALACASLGGSYGILFSNHWNFYTLAQHGHVFFSKFFTKLNTHHIPVYGVMLEACLCISYLVLTQGNQEPLQQLSSLGVTIAYTITILGLFRAQKQAGNRLLIPLLGLASCSLFMVTCLRNFILMGSGSLIFFGILMAFGISGFFLTHFQRHKGDDTENKRHNAKTDGNL